MLCVSGLIGILLTDGERWVMHVSRKEKITFLNDV